MSIPVTPVLSDLAKDLLKKSVAPPTEIICVNNYTCCGVFEMSIRNSNAIREANEETLITFIMKAIKLVPKNRLIVFYYPENLNIKGMSKEEEDDSNLHFIKTRNALRKLGFRTRGKFLNGNTGHDVAMMICYKDV